MTVSSDRSKIVHVFNGAVRDYVYNFKAFEERHLRVLRFDKDYRKQVLTPGLDYTVSGLGSDSGGRVSLTAPGFALFENGDSLVILRSMLFVQETDYKPQGKFPAESHERALDVLTMQDQELLEMVGRAIVAPENMEAGEVTYGTLVGLRDEAVAARDEAEKSEEAAAGSAALAERKALEAWESAALAGEKADAAAGSAVDAARSAGLAGRAETRAEAAAGAAEESARAAENSALQAEKSAGKYDAISGRVTVLEGKTFELGGGLEVLSWRVSTAITRLTESAVRQDLALDCLRVGLDSAAKRLDARIDGVESDLAQSVSELTLAAEEAADKQDLAIDGLRGDLGSTAKLIGDVAGGMAGVEGKTFELGGGLEVLSWRVSTAITRLTESTVRQELALDNLRGDLAQTSEGLETVEADLARVKAGTREIGGGLEVLSRGTAVAVTRLTESAVRQDLEIDGLRAGLNTASDDIDGLNQTAADCMHFIWQNAVAVVRNARAAILNTNNIMAIK